MTNKKADRTAIRENWYSCIKVNQNKKNRDKNI